MYTLVCKSRLLKTDQQRALEPHQSLPTDLSRRKSCKVAEKGIRQSGLVGGGNQTLGLTLDSSL